MFTLIMLSAALAAAPPEASELPDDLAAVYIEAMASVKNGDHQKVSDLLDQVNQGAPDFDDAFRNRCTAERLLGNGDEARRLCQHAVEVEDSWVNHAGLVRDTLAGGGYDLALRDANAALKAYPDNLELLKLLCDAAMRAEDYDQLEEGINAINTAHGENAWAEFYRYALQMQRCEADAAAETMLKAAELGLSSKARTVMGRITPRADCTAEPSRMWIAVAGVAGALSILVIAGVLLRRKR